MATALQDRPMPSVLAWPLVTVNILLGLAMATRASVEEWQR
jgi:hypothetical protein